MHGISWLSNKHTMICIDYWLSIHIIVYKHIQGMDSGKWATKVSKEGNSRRKKSCQVTAKFLGEQSGR